MDVTIEHFDPDRHDARAVASLIYQADPALMRFVFGDEGAAVPVIAKLVGMDHNEYAGRRVTCALDEGQLVGVIAGLTGAQRREAKKEAGREWGKALGVKGMFRALKWGTKLESVATTDIGDNEYYISALTVDERCRGKGVGSKLLAEVFRSHDVVITDVNIAKDDAIRFYERNGFAIEKKMTFEHEGTELGNYKIRRG